MYIKIQNYNSNPVLTPKYQNCISQVWDEVWKFFFGLKHRISQKLLQRGIQDPRNIWDAASSDTSQTSEKAVRKGPGKPNIDVAWFDNGHLIT